MIQTSVIQLSPVSNKQMFKRLCQLIQLSAYNNKHILIKSCTHVSLATARKVTKKSGKFEMIYTAVKM